MWKGPWNQHDKRESNDPAVQGETKYTHYGPTVLRIQSSAKEFSLYHISKILTIAQIGLRIAKRAWSSISSSFQWIIADERILRYIQYLKYWLLSLSDLFNLFMHNDEKYLASFHDCTQEWVVVSGTDITQGELFHLLWQKKISFNPLNASIFLI